MNDLAFYEIFFNDCTNPCCITDVDNYAVVYKNTAMSKLLNDFSDHTDKRCYEYVYGKSEPCEFCPNNKIANDEFYESSVYNELLKGHFRVNNLLLERKGKRLNLCKYTINTSLTQNKLSLNEAISACSEILNQNRTENSINSFITLLDSFYSPNKAYIVQIDFETNSLKKLNNWTDSSHEALFHKEIDAKQLAYLIQNLCDANENKVVTLSEILDYYRKNASDRVADLTSNYKEIVFSPIHNKTNAVIGFIGLVGDTVLDQDYELLVSVSNFIDKCFTQSNIFSNLEVVSEIDELTGFYARGIYAKQLSHYSRVQPTKLGVLSININGLRKVNESLGSEEGDKLILESATLLKKYFKEPFYRISGDEFICFVENSSEEDFLERVDCLHNEMHEKNNKLFAIGQSYKDGHIDASKMITEADTMMYINKQDYYHSSNRQSKDVKHTVLNELLEAFEDGEFMVYLQPQFRLKDESLIGAEALIRRYSKKQGKMIFPDQFIPLYENNSVIRHIDFFVLEEICKLIVAWKNLGHELQFSVNFSRVTLLEHDVVESICEICDKYNVDRNKIILEVTERVGLIENNVPSDLIVKFKKAGFRISLDDFGCAYSNIVTLAQVRFDEVKIDKSLVDNLLSSEENRVIVKSVLDMCHNLKDTETLAEGIETREQADLLKELGSSYAQGYLFSKPISIEDFYAKYIESHV